MAIDQYQKKRNFRQTPEPSASKGKRKPSYKFVVQRHQARRLHYDLRLELRGVLKSWAIPKGPSMDPADKRLAVMVEDHPLEYAGFHGEIPEGNYGAGLMDIWDRGVYRPVKENGDPEKSLERQLEKGSLKIVLLGKYLKGEFALVKIKDSEKNEWLLIKKDDGYATGKFDIEKIEPLLKAEPAGQKTAEKGKVENAVTGKGEAGKEITGKGKAGKEITGKGKARKEKTGNYKAGQKEADKLVPEGGQSGLPEEIPRPMLARLSPQVIDRPDWIYEIKYDGYRVISSINDGKVNLYSRNGHNYSKKYEALAKELEKAGQQVILDGEVVIENEKGLSDFQLLQNYDTTRRGELKYYVFDILYLNGVSLTGFPLTDRKELLDLFFSRNRELKNIFKSEYRTGGGREFFEELSGDGYEGMIAKAAGGTYLPGRRSDSWLKVKTHKMQEAIICGYTESKAGRKFGSIIMGLYHDGDLKYIGNCGSGFNDISLKDLHERFRSRVIAKCPFPDVPKFSYPKGRPVWLRPELVCNVKFAEWSQEGIMRHPVFMGLRQDKDAGEIVKEDVEAGGDGTGSRDNENGGGSSKSKGQDADRGSAASKGSKGSKGKRKYEQDNEAAGSGSSGKEEVKEKTFTISGKKVKCTNLSKIYWPEEGYTKGQLIEFYRSIAKFIIPHLRDRPQSLNRYPDGIKGKSFYHKNMDEAQLPEWIKTAKISSGSKREGYINYLLCNDTATLIYMANLGCIEINPWHSTFEKPDNPTYMMLDLDPGNISFKKVVETALVIREICDELKIPCYCKTSGATGMHIYIPLGARYTYNQVKSFAQIMAVITHNRLPEFTSIERSTSKRRDKIYIDFLQNRKGQTIAAPYSVRPRPHATVSAPVDWDEVNEDLDPRMFTILNMPRRLEEKGDIWRPVLEKGIVLKDMLGSVEKLL